MTNSTSTLLPASTQGSKLFIQIPLDLVRYARTLNLTGVQYNLWLYLYELDPYGDRWVEIPTPEELALLLRANVRTIQRAAQRLADCELFEFHIKGWRARNTMVSVKASDFSPDKGIRMRTNRSKLQQRDLFVQPGISLPEENQDSLSEPALGRNSGNEDCTNCFKQTFKETTEHCPSPHPVAPTLNREESGTEAQISPRQEIQQASDLIQQAGVKPNKTIYKTIAALRSQQGAAASLKAVKNAISALQEQQQRGNLRNPGGFIVAALRGNFTGNRAKKEARQVRQASPPDLVQVASAVDHALRAGDRGFAVAKLQALWLEGWREEVAEVCVLRKQEWGFVVTAGGVEDSG